MGIECLKPPELLLLISTVFCKSQVADGPQDDIQIPHLLMSLPLCNTMPGSVGEFHGLFLTIEHGAHRMSLS